MAKFSTFRNKSGNQVKDICDGSSNRNLRNREDDFLKSFEEDIVMG